MVHGSREMSRGQGSSEGQVRVNTRGEPDRRLDLQGEVCPTTLVKTILALEEMEAGQVLDVTVDHAPAAEDVPRSLASRGHGVLKVVETGSGVWSIRVRKAQNE